VSNVPAATANPVGVSLPLGHARWSTALRRSRLGRMLIRRLPRRVKRVLRIVRRWQRSVEERAISRWHRSLQLRVVATTLVISAVVIAVLGFFLTQQIAAGLLESLQKSAAVQLSDGLRAAEGAQPDLLKPPQDSSHAKQLMYTAAADLQQSSGDNSTYNVVIMLTASRVSFPVYTPSMNAGVNVAATIPRALIASVEAKQQAGGDNIAPSYSPTKLVYRDAGTSSVSALVVGAPLGSYYQLYYVFPATQEQQTLLLVQKTLIGVGVALVVLLAAIASLVTRWVVLPVRHAAQAAQRLSAGQLEERMQVRGADDLAALATSFNEMAASLQDKLRELEELSSVQLQFVSDVSHELRTPLTTIRMAGDVLFESKEQFDPASARSAELLQSQIERFEALLVDLLEISRYDANAATLEAEPVDVCDLVRRSADDAQQLSERRGARIEFRLPARCEAEVDRRRVERILRNILVNAVEHGEGKDVVVTVDGDRDAVAVAVRDHGVGLHPGEDQLVFDRFWRADPSRARTSGGTGLGLAIALEDARLHGGWLQAWGEPGKGCVFRLTLPREAGQELAGSPLPLGPDEAEVITSSEELDAAVLEPPGLGAAVLGSSVLGSADPAASTQVSRRG
jgi:two-component system sensor histidine kinase MtrB